MAVPPETADHPQDRQDVKPCSGAGAWFPADPRDLRSMVERFLDTETPAIPEPPVALIVPHAGYQYAGEVAGKAYAALREHPYRRVILLGLSHRVAVRGASVLTADAYETPLGLIPVDREARDTLLGSSVVTERTQAHREEHSVENQLPMLQVALGEFSMVEVLVGDMTGRERTELAGVLRDLIDGETLIVVSTDFTHYGRSFTYTPFRDRVEENLKALNDLAVQEILQVDVPGWDEFIDETRDTICGRNAVGLLLEVLQPWDDARGLRVSYDTSGRMTGDFSTSVTYASVVFWREKEGLSEAEQQILLKLARDVVTSYLQEGRMPQITGSEYELTPRLKAPGAAFVTLKNDGQLRGCIGHVIAAIPLYESVAENAYQSCRDARFTGNPVTGGEVPELQIEISVLTPMRRLLDPKKVEVGRDGLMMIRGRRSGLLLPQVPVEQGWDRNEFLVNTCLKAGLPIDAWKDTETEILRFSAQVFGEEEHDPGNRGN